MVFSSKNVNDLPVLKVSSFMQHRLPPASENGDGLLRGEQRSPLAGTPGLSEGLPHSPTHGVGSVLSPLEM